MQNLEPKTDGRLFQDSKIRTQTLCPFPFLPSQKYSRTPPLIRLFPHIDRQRNLLQCEQVWVWSKETKAWRQKLLRSLVFMNMTKNKIVWSGLVSLDDGWKAFEHLMDPFFCIGRIFRYHEFYVRICVWKTPRFLLLLLTSTLLPTLAPLSPPPPPSLHVILLLPKAKYRYKTYDKL